MSHEIYQKYINLGIFCDLKDHLNNFSFHFINEEMETYTGFGFPKAMQLLATESLQGRASTSCSVQYAMISL